MRYVVTGAAGFIGSAISRRLLAAGHNVLGIDSLSPYYSPKLKEENLRALESDRFRLIIGDLNELDLADLLINIDIVFHQAGQPGVRSSWGEGFASYTTANVNATQRLLDAASASEVGRLVYASSSSVYGEVDVYPSSEDSLPRPVSPYGVTKLAGEHLCRLYATNFDFHTVSLRYFTVYGPGQRPDMAFTRFCEAAVRGESIMVNGSGDQIRDFTFVEDVVDANMRAAEGVCEPGSVLNVAGGSAISINSVLSLLEEISDRRLHVQYRPFVKGDVTRTGGCTTAIERSLGWRPQVQIADGLEAQYRWAAKRYEAGVGGSLHS